MIWHDMAWYGMAWHGMAGLSCTMLSLSTGVWVAVLDPYPLSTAHGTPTTRSLLCFLFWL